MDILHTIAGYLPEIKAPEGTLGTKERLIWTALALVLYFMMLETTAFGVMPLTAGADFLQTITASKVGSLLTTGIGPIVLASIFLQLFVGAGILDMDLKDKAQRAKFLEIQKILSYIVNDNQRAAEVIRRLRSLLKKSAPEMKPLDINALINETVVLIATDAAVRNDILKF